jgi:hypothetical protein
MIKEEFNNFINLTVGSSPTNSFRDVVQNEFAWKGGTCVQLDKLLRDIRDKIVAERLKFSNDYYIQALLDQKAVLEMSFASNSCSDKIETQRQKETAVLITKTSIDQEKKVLGSSKKEENIYIGVGALVLLVGLFIVLKK